MPKGRFSQGGVIPPVRPCATQDIMDHRWYRAAHFSWTDLHARRIPAPFKPPISDPLDSSNFDPYPEDDRVAPYRGPAEHFEGF